MKVMPSSFTKFRRWVLDEGFDFEIYRGISFCRLLLVWVDFLNWEKWNSLSSCSSVSLHFISQRFLVSSVSSWIIFEIAPISDPKSLFIWSSFFDLPYADFKLINSLTKMLILLSRELPRFSISSNALYETPILSIEPLLEFVTDNS